MNEPIKSGDVCSVIGGLGRSKSPNIGKTVTVVSARGEHSQHGRVFRCTGDGIVQLGNAGNYVVTGWADFPVSWLLKVEPPKQGNKSTKKELEDA